LTGRSAAKGSAPVAMIRPRIPVTAVSSATSGSNAPGGAGAAAAPAGTVALAATGVRVCELTTAHAG